METIDDDELHHRLYPNETQSTSARMPDYDHVHKELLRPGVTLRLLWDEYVASCRSAGCLCIQYSQFCKLYRDYADRHRLTMHIRHKPGDKMMVDWVGKPLQLCNLAALQSWNDSQLARIHDLFHNLHLVP